MKHFLFNKNFLLFFFCLILNTVTSVAISAAGKEPSPQHFPFGQMPKPTDAELTEMFDLMSKLSPEELEALADLGQKYIEEMEAQGVDVVKELGLDELFNEEQFNQPITLPATPEITPEAKEQPAVPATSSAKLQAAQKTLESLVQLLTSLEEKAQENRTAQEKIAPFRYNIQDLVYFAQTLMQKKLLKHLVAPEFEQLYNKLNSLEQKIKAVVPYINFKEMAIETHNPYTILGVNRDASWQEITEKYQQLLKEKDPKAAPKKLAPTNALSTAVEKKSVEPAADLKDINAAYTTIFEEQQALQALDKALDAIQQSVEVGAIFADIKKLLEAYEPESLRLKEEQEKIETKARQEQEEALRRRPMYTPPVIDRPFNNDRGGFSGLDNYLTTTPSQPFIGGAGSSGDNKIAPSTSSSGNKSGGKSSSGSSKTPGEKAESPSKDKSKDKSDGDKKGDAKKDPKVAKKMENIEKEIRNLVIFITDGDIVKSTPAPKNLFKNFITNYLVTPIVHTVGTPYDKNSQELQKAQQIKDALVELTSKINKIRAEIRTADLDLTASQKRQLRLQINATLKHYQDQINTPLKDLFDIFIDETQAPSGLITRTIKISGTPLPVQPEYTYLFLGSDFPNINAPNNKALKDINSSEENYIGLFKETYKQLTEEVNKKI